MTMTKEDEGVDWELVLMVIACISCLITGVIVGWVTAPDCESRVVEKKVYVGREYNGRFDSVDDDLSELIKRGEPEPELDMWGDPVKDRWGRPV